MLKYTIPKSLIMLLIGFMLTIGIERYDLQRSMEERKREAEKQIDGIKSRLEEKLSKITPLSQKIAQQLAENPEANFAQLNEMTDKAFTEHKGVLNVAIARDLTVYYANPLRGNETLLGLNYAYRPDLMEGVRQAMTSRAGSVSGPFKLVQYATKMGVIARSPVFISTEKGKPGSYWGLVSVVTDLHGLLEDVGLLNPNNPFEVALKNNGGHSAKETFFGDYQLFKQTDVVMREIRLPGGSWHLAAVLKNYNQKDMIRRWSILIIGLALSFALSQLMIHGGRACLHVAIMKGWIKLRGFFITLLFLVVLPLIILQGWFSYSTVLRSAEQFEQQLSQGIVERIHDKVVSFFEVPRQTVVFNAEQFRAGLLNPAQRDLLARDFLLQLRYQPLLTALSLGDANGQYVSANRPPMGEDRGLRMERASIDENRILKTFRADHTNKFKSPIVSENVYFDARNQPWFSSAVATSSAVWSPIYSYTTKSENQEYHGLAVGMSAPVYDSKGTFSGVVSADLSLSQLNTLFMDVMKDSGGVVFVTGAEGDLLASSAVEPTFNFNGDQAIRIKATDSENLLIRAGGLAIQKAGTPDGSSASRVDGDRHFVDWWRYQLPDGPAFTIALAIPTNQFDAPIKDVRGNVIFVVIAILLFIFLFALFIADWVGKPLVILSQWATRLNTKEWGAKAPIATPILEVTELSSALDGLADRLKHQADELEKQVAERTSELKYANGKLAELSMTDGLTGVANRRRFDEALLDELARAHRMEQSLALILIDVDHFKKYNDHYGHQAGDQCLSQIALTLCAFAHRPGDLIARYGGEEFVMIAIDTDIPRAIALGEVLRRSVETLAIPHSRSSFSTVTISAGVSVCAPGQTLGPSELLSMADRSLYRAKKAGRNRIGHPCEVEMA